MGGKATAFPLLLAAALGLACGEKKAAPAEERDKSQVDIEVERWEEKGLRPPAFNDDSFLALAKNVFGTVMMLVPPKRGTRVFLTGSLEVRDGDAVVTLKARIRVEGLADPIESGIGALGVTRTVERAQSFVEKALFDLADASLDLVGLVDARTGRLITALGSPEPDEQILALRLLGARKAVEALEAIGDKLDDPRENVAEAAAEALGDIGDERAIPMLVKAVRRGDLRSEVRAIEAMGRIGGKEAEAYLEMTAVGHELEEVRALSQKLLDPLRSRRRIPAGRR